MLERSLKPGMGRRLGAPPVARISLVYGYDLPDLVDTLLELKSTESTSPSTIDISPESYHS